MFIKIQEEMDLDKFYRNSLTSTNNDIKFKREFLNLQTICFKPYLVASCNRKNKIDFECTFVGLELR